MRKDYMTLRLFARKFGYLRSDSSEFQMLVKRLQRMRALDLQQSGFNADSLSHYKTVAIKDWDTINTVFGQPQPLQKRREKNHHTITIYRFQCAKPELECPFLKDHIRQGLVCTFHSSCNQKRWKDDLDG